MIVIGAYMPDYISSRLQQRIEQVEHRWASYRELELEVDTNCYRESTSLTKTFKYCLFILAVGAYPGSNTRDPFLFIVPYSFALLNIFGLSFYMTWTNIREMQGTIGPNSWNRISMETNLRFLSEELDQTRGVQFDPAEPTICLAEAKDRVRIMTSALFHTPPKGYLLNVIITYGFALVCFVLLLWFICIQRG